MFVNCEFNSNVHEVFTESLEIVWKKAREVLWHYLNSFKSYGEFILGEVFLAHSGDLLAFLYVKSHVVDKVSQNGNGNGNGKMEMTLCVDLMVLTTLQNMLHITLPRKIQNSIILTQK